MSFVFTVQQLSAMIPSNKSPAAWHKAMLEVFPKYSINTRERVAGFTAQCAHESTDFNVLEENLNYSAERLRVVFPRYFGPGKANPAEYARNPQKLANYVYMDINRSKAGALGNTQPGDGWRFRGRGIKQLTGRNNYAAFGRTVGMTAEQAAEYVATPKGALESACWFWNSRNLNSFADKRDITGMSRAINGGDIGLADRVARWNRALLILNNK
jgi:putative chitinase